MSASDPPVRQGMSPALVVVALACMLGLQPLATDLYLPALPHMSRELHIRQSEAQWTLSSLVLAMGVAQLFWGGWSDRMGRKPTLLLGLVLLLVSSVLTVLAQDLLTMIIGRTGQGIGLAATTVCARAMVRDLYEPQHGARVLSRSMTGLGLIALFGPVLGGLTADVWGWRHALAIVGVLSLGLLFLTGSLLHETLPADRRSSQQSWPERWKLWKRMLGHPMFRSYSALTSSTYGGLYVFLAAASFVFIDQLGLSRTAFGLWMSTLSLAYIMGTILCQRRLVHRSLPDTVRLGAWLSAAGGAWCALVSLLCHAGLTPQMWWFMPGFWMYVMAHGIHQPCSQMGITAAFPAAAGGASALAGCINSAVAFGIGAVLSAWMDSPAWAHSVHPLTLGMGIMGMVTAWVALSPVQKHGHC